jgi:hypothetical protein
MEQPALAVLTTDNGLNLNQTTEERQDPDPTSKIPQPVGASSIGNFHTQVNTLHVHNELFDNIF